MQKPLTGNVSLEEVWEKELFTSKKVKNTKRKDNGLDMIYGCLRFISLGEQVGEKTERIQVELAGLYKKSLLLLNISFRQSGKFQFLKIEIAKISFLFVDY